MRTIKMTVLAATALVFAGAAAPAAAETQSLSIAIVDINKVMHKTAAAEGIRAELNSKGKQFQNELENHDKTLRAEKEALAKKKDSLSSDDLARQVKELETKYDKAERLLQERRATLSQANNASMGKLMSEATKIIADIAKEKGYDAILTQEAVILASQSMDITEEVIARLNKNVKKIAIDWSAQKAPKKQ